MRAITIKKYGGPEVLQEEEVNVPQYSSSQVLVEVYASSVNPVDCNIRAGRVQDIFPITKFPHILGIDVSGVVKEVGSTVKGLKQGDRVFGLGVSGTYAQYVVANADQLSIISNDISFQEAGALPAVALTAWSALIEYGKIKKGERVLIHGGAGGVGHIAIQIAKILGAYVITTASQSNHDFVKQLGADEVIDYTKEDFSKKVKEVDIVFDFIVGLDQRKNSEVLSKGGRIISIVTPQIGEMVKVYGVKGEFVKVEPKREHLAQIEQWVVAKKLQVHINKIFNFDKDALLEAHTIIEAKHTRGKLVINIQDDVI